MILFVCGMLVGGIVGANIGFEVVRRKSKRMARELVDAEYERRAS